MPDLDAFAGRWRIARQIDDRRAGQMARFDGEVVFMPEGPGLRYEETGVMHLPGQPPMQATRRYDWRPGAGGIEVFFDDGRFFHTIGPGAQPRARHECAPDLYRVAYDFTGWPLWRAVWQVSGPRKDYEMVTRYARAE